MYTAGNYSISESDLIEGCIRGDRQLQQELYNRFAGKMYAVCLRYAGHPEDAQDLLQEGFVKVFRNLHRFRAEGSFEGWIRRVFINTCIEYFRRRSLDLSRISEREEQTIGGEEANALDHLAEKDILELIRDLSPGYRTVFNLYVIEGYSHREIADQLGISEGTSKSQLARARTALQQRVRELHPDTQKSVSR